MTQSSSQSASIAIEESIAALRLKFNQETARIHWRELQRFFAQGKVIQVASGLDLIEIAIQISGDDAEAINAGLEAGEITLVPDAQARTWIECDAEVWAVVVLPWVLVQE